MKAITFDVTEDVGLMRKSLMANGTIRVFSLSNGIGVLTARGKLGLVAHDFNSSTPGAEGRGFPPV